LDLQKFLSTYLPEPGINLRPTADDDRSIGREVKQCIKENNYDVIHSHGFSAGALVSIAIALKPSPPHVMTVHDVYRDELFKGAKGKLKLAGLNILYSRLNAV